MDEQNRAVPTETVRRLRAMGTEELQRLLRTDLVLGADESDTDLVISILEELESREEPAGAAEDDAALERLREKLARYERMFAGLGEAPAEEPRHRRRLVRVVSIAAAVVLLLAIGVATAGAKGWDLWGGAVHWTKETFGFGERQPAFVDNEAYREFENTLSERGVTIPVLPKWLPEPYTVQDHMVLDYDDMLKIFALATAGEETMTFQILWFQDRTDYGMVYEGDPSTLRTYEAGGVTHYVMDNIDSIQIVWARENYQLCVSCTDCDIDEERLINSIYWK